MKKIMLLLAAVTGIVALGVFAGTAGAKSSTIGPYDVQYTGQGFYYDGATYTLNDERCGLTGQAPANDGSTGQFANWNGAGQPYETGQGYLVWVLTLKNTTTTPQLVLPDGTVSMISVGGTWKYASQYYAPDEITNIVHATATALSGQNPQLVVSHGCQPVTEDAAWCSPGFWRNANPNAFAQTINPATNLPYSASDFFDSTVYDYWFGSQLGATITLQNVLNAPSTYGGPPDPGTSGYALNAYNAVGAMLTDGLPGYAFDFDMYSSGTENCPIDNHGAWK